MKVGYPRIEATQPDPVNVTTLAGHDDVVVTEVDINRPKRPEVHVQTTQLAAGEWEVLVTCAPSEGTPEHHRMETVRLNFDVWCAKQPLVMIDAGRYNIVIVFVGDVEQQ